MPYKNKAGELSYREGRVVIMLVGESGIFQEGRRHESQPLWLTKWQIKHMGKLVRELCYDLGQRNSNKEEEAQSFYKSCLNDQDKVKFQGGSEDKVYWGDLPDYDKTLFRSYKESLDSSEEASFSPSNNLW